MQKYKIGVVALLVLTLGLSVYVLTLGANAKQDKQTYEKASEVAEKLNTWVRNNSKIPDNLEQAGISDVPSTIEYTKKDSSHYEVCVTYKADKTYSASSYNIFGALSGANLNSSLDDYQQTDYERSTLYFSYVYKKGRNCQTVKPYFYSSNTYQYNSNSSTEDDTESTYEYTPSESTLESYRTAQKTYCSTSENRDRYESYCKSVEDYLEKYDN